MAETSFHINTVTEAFIQEHLHSPVAALYLKSVPAGIDLDFVAQQINGRLKGVKKLPSWSGVVGLIWPSKLALEQCSSEQTARFKAQLTNGNNLLDMTGGFGVDSYFFSKAFKAVDYIENNENLFKTTRHNLQLLGSAHINFHQQDSVLFLKENQKKYDWIYLDPYRRDKDRKSVFFIEDCTPNVIELLPQLLAASDNIMVKFSPMLDLSILLKNLSNIVRIIIVAVKNECKELLVILSNQNKPVQVTAVDIYPDRINRFDTLFSSTNNTTVIFGAPTNYLYEPNKAILKTGLQDKLCEDFQFQKLAPHSHLYTSDQLHLNFPGRVFSIENIIKPKALARVLPDKKANIIVRNFPLKAPAIFQKYKIVPGGDLYIIATTLLKKEKVFILGKRIF